MKFSWIPKHLEKYIIISIATIVIILDIFNITSNSIIFEVILAVLALLVFSLIKFENKFDNFQTSSKFVELSKFNQNRGSLPSFEKSFSIAKEEIIIWAACLGSAIVKLRLIKSKLEQRCKIKILIMCLKDELGNKNPLIEHVAKLSKNYGFEDRLNIAHKELRDFHNSLEKEYKKLIEIRVYNTFPTATYLFIDKDKNQGFIIAEPLFIGLWADELPSLEVTPFNGSSLYNVLKRSFDEIWSNSKDFIENNE